MAMKDASWRRYASGRCLATFDPEISEWGNPTVVIDSDFTQVKSIPREVKHLSTWWKRKKAAEWQNISLVAASETEIAQTLPLLVRGCKAEASYLYERSYKMYC